MGHDRCSRLLAKAKRSPKAEKLLGFLNRSGKDGANKVSLLCKECSTEGPEGGARAYFASPPHMMVVCHNRVHDEKEIETAVVHELIHAVDYVARDMNLGNCKMLACSEIRAARGSECSKQYLTHAELLFMKLDAFRSKGFQYNCVQEQAVRATEAIFPKEARGCVVEMMGKCYEDKVGFQTFPDDGE